MNVIEQLTVFLTSKCNMNCRYCFLGDKGTEVIDFVIVKKAIKLMMQEDSKKYKGISFFGGEPLLQKELLFSIAEYVRNFYGNKISLSITTNGTLLDHETMEKIKKYNIFVVLSLDGADERANKNRVMLDGTCCWAIICKRLQDICIKDIGAVRLTVVPENVYMLYDNILGLYKMGFECINFALDFTSTWTKSYIDIYQEQYCKVIEFYEEEMIKGKKIKIEVIDNIIHSAIEKKVFKCRYGCGNLAIAADGKVYKCHREVFEKGIIGFELEDYILQKENVNCENYCVTDSICIDCELYKRCSFCMINIRNNGGSLIAIPEVICKINQINIMGADKLANSLYEKKCKAFLDRFY